MKKWIVLSSFMILAMLAALITGQPATAAPRLQTGTLAVSPAAAAQSGILGNLVQYTLTVTNNGTAEALINSSISGNAWVTSASPNQLTLAAGAQGSVTVTVAVPGNASAGSTDVASVAFVSGLDASSASAVLTTTATNPTATPPPGTLRPLIVLESYTSGGAINPGREFDLSIKLSNVGQRTATNMVISFGGTDFLPRATGGVRAVANLDAGNKVDIIQPMFAPLSLWGYSYGSVPVNITYNDANGGSYTEAFVLTLNLVVPVWGGTATPTATPTQQARPQLVVSGYSSDVDPLQPGSVFELGLEIRNLGTADARSITMVVGGTASVDASGTAVPGGISGAGSDMTNFAPLGSSNLVFLGDITAGSLLQANQKLIVNVSANPGAYPLKLSFVYTAPNGQRMIDDQVITWRRFREFVWDAAPIILLGSMALGVLYETGWVWELGAVLKPIVEGWLLLPMVAGLTLVFAVLRKELALQLLLVFATVQAGGAVVGISSFMTTSQIVTYAIVNALYIPCVATIAVLGRELGWRRTAVICAGTHRDRAAGRRSRRARAAALLLSAGSPPGGHRAGRAPTPMPEE